MTGSLHPYADPHPKPTPHLNEKSHMSGRAGAMQPTVDWRLVVTDCVSQTNLVVEGHVEVRWSHGRFLGAPEAKVKLDTALRAVPGYLALDD